MSWVHLVLFYAGKLERVCEYFEELHAVGDAVLVEVAVRVLACQGEVVGQNREVRELHLTVTVRVAAERGGPSRRGALLMAADLRGADLDGVDLTFEEKF